MSSAIHRTPFSRLIAGLMVDGGSVRGELPGDWLQGRTAYGGLSAAIALHAARTLIPNLPALRSAQFCFLGPASGLLRASPVELRRGKSSVFVSVDVEGEKGLAARTTFCFGGARSSYLNHSDVPMPSVPPPDACPPFFGSPGQPAFMDHFDGRLAAGARPMTPRAKPDMSVWLRHGDPDAGSDTVALLAMADALPPPGTVLFRDRAPISTVTWTIDVLGATPPKTADGWLLSRSRAETIRSGWSTQDMTIWSPDGDPVLRGRQLVATFEGD